jgi:hypothetical protein
MRGQAEEPVSGGAEHGAASSELVALLRGIRTELEGARAALERGGA